MKYFILVILSFLVGCDSNFGVSNLDLRVDYKNNSSFRVYVNSQDTVCMVNLSYQGKYYIKDSLMVDSFFCGAAILDKKSQMWHFANYYKLVDSIYPEIVFWSKDGDSVVVMCDTNYTLINLSEDYSSIELDSCFGNPMAYSLLDSQRIKIVDSLNYKYGWYESFRSWKSKVLKYFISY